MGTQGLAVCQTYLWVTAVQPRNTVINFCLGRPDIQQEMVDQYNGKVESIGHRYLRLFKARAKRVPSLFLCSLAEGKPPFQSSVNKLTLKLTG